MNFRNGTLADLNDTLARLQRRFQCRPNLLEGSEQSCGTAIAEPNPDELKLPPRSTSEVEEVFILADDNALVGGGVLAELGVGGLGKPDFENVFAIHIFLPEIDGQGGGQLVIDQKLHEA
jgi:hypothetical protein